MEMMQQQTEAASTATTTRQQATPLQQMQPPTDHPYNFYLPQFNNEDDKNLDAKSIQMKEFSPPPELNKNQKNINYYAVKPKKLPKKFNASTKQINLKWLNAHEKNAAINTPKSIYLIQDEKNRINFDDSFFAVDMLLNAPHDNEQKDTADAVEDDLMATAAFQIPLINYSYQRNEQKRI